MNNASAIIGFMPHGMCYVWNSWLIWMHILGNGIIALSYFSIPLILLYVLRKRKDIPFNGIFLLFSAFILFCGTGHAFDIWTLWHPNYWLSNSLRLLTAIVSLTTAIALTVKIPAILALPSPDRMASVNQQLEEKINELKQQQTIISQQKEFLRAIYDNVREAIFVVDISPTGEFRYRGFNAAAIKLTGIAEVENKTPQEILPFPVAQAVEERYQKCVVAKTAMAYEECLLLEGKDTWWLTKLNPLLDETGKVFRLIGMSLNISDRKQAELELDREKNFLQALLDNLSDGIVACDERGVLTLFNKATQEFHGLPEKSLPAEAWAEYYDLYLPDGKTVMSLTEIPLVRALKGESVRDIEMMIIPKQGQPRTILANGDPIVDRQGNKIGAIAAMRDITDRRQAEEALKQANERLEKFNEELEKRVKQRTLEIEQTNALLLATTVALEQRNEELDRFAYVASHDLKAPLRAIANLSEWIEEDLADKMDEESSRNMTLLRNRVYRLRNLIDGLLEYSRIGRLKSPPELVSVQQMLDNIIDLMDVPPKVEIEIVGDMPSFVTNAITLQQVFHNLISNAIEHNDGHPNQIVISVSETQDFYQFAVADRGKGIDPRYHERIFNIFQTLEARDTRESTGIGLSIVKKAVESQGGSIELDSQLGRGCTFKFTWKKDKVH